VILSAGAFTGAFTPPPPTPVAKLSVRNGYVRTNGGLTFAFPGDNGVVEIETLVTINAASGVDCVVLRSLDGQKMISNLEWTRQNILSCLQDIPSCM
jgi:hypothetical protein